MRVSRCFCFLLFSNLFSRCCRCIVMLMPEMCDGALRIGKAFNVCAYVWYLAPLNSSLSSSARRNLHNNDAENSKNECSDCSVLVALTQSKANRITIHNDTTNNKLRLSRYWWNVKQQQHTTTILNYMASSESPETRTLEPNDFSELMAVDGRRRRRQQSTSASNYDGTFRKVDQTRERPYSTMKLSQHKTRTVFAWQKKMPGNATHNCERQRRQNVCAILQGDQNNVVSFWLVGYGLQSSGCTAMMRRWYGNVECRPNSLFVYSYDKRNGWILCELSLESILTVSVAIGFHLVTICRKLYAQTGLARSHNKKAVASSILRTSMISFV